MKIILRRIGGITFLAWATSAMVPFAHAASFDCAKAKTRAEKVICADPQLSKLDEELATAYRAALTVWGGRIADYVKMTQRGWMGGRALTPPGISGGGIMCDDDAQRVTCLRSLYTNRIAILKSPGFRFGGIYMRDQDMLRIRPVPGGLEAGYALAGPDVAQGFTNEGNPVRVTPGQATLTFPFAADGANTCRLDAAFAADAVVLTQHGSCSGESLGGRWVRAMDRDPDDESF